MNNNPTEKSQLDRFKEMARDLECDEDEDAFKEKLKHVLQRKPKDNKKE